mmetsp:Transcript_5053/g.11431  ORF Transcript_5053/g.11431 Transcript_5053/m.11431 type:complete len:312 (+) Transcript_5053:850-1785(+)
MGGVFLGAFRCRCIRLSLGSFDAVGRRRRADAELENVLDRRSVVTTTETPSAPRGIRDLHFSRVLLVALLLKVRVLHSLLLLLLLLALFHFRILLAQVVLGNVVHHRIRLGAEARRNRRLRGFFVIHRAARPATLLSVLLGPRAVLVLVASLAALLGRALGYHAEARLDAVAVTRPGRHGGAAGGPPDGWGDTLLGGVGIPTAAGAELEGVRTALAVRRGRRMRGGGVGRGGFAGDLVGEPAGGAFGDVLHLVEEALELLGRVGRGDGLVGGRTGVGSVVVDVHRQNHGLDLRCVLLLALASDGNPPVFSS